MIRVWRFRPGERGGLFVEDRYRSDENGDCSRIHTYFGIDRLLATMTSPSSDFPVERLVAWYEANGRHDLPWRDAGRSPYELLVAEILLQRTTATAVRNLYEPFLARFPTPAAAVAAPSDDVEAMTAPLGLARRAEYVQRSAARMLDRHDGAIPRDRARLLEFHGVGKYTARSLLAHCYGENCCAVDTNVERILRRYFDLDPTGPAVADIADDLVPPDRASEFLHALLDFGAEVCTARSPACEACPMADSCASAAVESPG